MTSELKIPKKPDLVTSAEVVDSIDDLLMQIYLSLPVKSLMHFKIVSKHWKSLISSPQFCLLRNPDPKAVGLFLPVRKRCGFVYIHFNPNAPLNPPFREIAFPGENPESFWISQSCNGLLVCCGSKGLMYKGGKFAVSKCCIYNPTTNQFRYIPTPSGDYLLGVHGVYMAFDRAKSYCKIISIRWADIYHKSLEILVYSSESGSWTASGERFCAGPNFFDYGVYWNNSINWISYASGYLLYYKVDEERVGWVPRPTEGWKMKHPEYFGVSCDHLHLIESNRTLGSVIIHEMMRDHSKWVAKYQVDLSSVAIACPRMVLMDLRLHRAVYEFSIYALVRGEQMKGSFLVMKIFNKFIRFNIGNGTFHEIFDLRGIAINDWYTYGGPLAFEYIESLSFI